MGHRHLGITVVPFQHIDEVSPNQILPHLVGIKVSFVGGTSTNARHSKLKLKLIKKNLASTQRTAF